MECFHNDYEPACHTQVGKDRIFAHGPLLAPVGKECAGYVAWLEGKPGYVEPTKLSTAVARS